MRHVQERNADLALDSLQLDLKALAKLEVEGAQRFVEEQDRRPVDQGTCKRHALLLSARELTRLRCSGGKPDEPEVFRDASAHLVRGHPLPAKAKRNVVLDAQVWEEGIALEDGVGRL